ncbi:MAG: YraN family protein [Terriglobales bacterium]
MIQLALRTLDAAANVLPWRRQQKEKPEVESEAAHLVTGRRGEEEAYFYLRRLGYVMVARNWRSPRHRGEIDLIGWDGDVLCFIEVKTRTTLNVKPAEAAVDTDKQRELSWMAQDYLRRAASRRSSVAGRMQASADSHVPGGGGEVCTSGSHFPPFRFDIVSVYYKNWAAPPVITLFRNAFTVA